MDNIWIINTFRWEKRECLCVPAVLNFYASYLVIKIICFQVVKCIHFGVDSFHDILPANYQWHSLYNYFPHIAHLPGSRSNVNSACVSTLVPGTPQLIRVLHMHNSIHAALSSYEPFNITHRSPFKLLFIANCCNIPNFSFRRENLVRIFDNRVHLANSKMLVWFEISKMKELCKTKVKRCFSVTKS